MTTVNIHEAKTHLSRLLASVARGEEFVIAKAGKPVARVIPYDGDVRKVRRVGFMTGQAKLPDDFDTFGAEEIERMFNEVE